MEDIPALYRWERPLGFITKRYGITFKPFPDKYDHGRLGVTFARTAELSPAYHAADPTTKTIWLEEEGRFNDWIHEVAHIVCKPPWEKLLNDSDEFAALFAFERRLALDLHLRGLARATDYRDVLRSQQTYIIPIELARLEGLTWNEWRKVPQGAKQRVINRSARICRSAGLFNEKNLPTYRHAKWDRVDQSTWNTFAPEISDAAARASARGAALA